MLHLHKKKRGYKEMYLLICAERNTGKINQVLLRLMNEKWVERIRTWEQVKGFEYTFLNSTDF